MTETHVEILKTIIETHVEILIPAITQTVIAPDTLEKLQVPDNFKDALHIYLAAENESPVVAENVNTTYDYGQHCFREQIAEVVEKVSANPTTYLTAILQTTGDPVPVDCNAILRSDIDRWVDDVVAAKVNVTYVMYHG